MFFYNQILKSFRSRIALAGLFAATVILFGAVGVRAQTPGDTDPTFGAGLAGVTTRNQPDGQVRVVAPLADGRVLVGGNFIEVGGTPQVGIARLNADGSPDTTFGAGQLGVSGAVSGLGVYAIAVQPDGKIVIGGVFSEVNGVTRGNLARLNADGTLDASFGNGLAGVTGPSFVDSIAVQPDGKTLIGGRFDQVNGVARVGLARLNADGTLDAAFPDSLSAGGRLTTIALQPDGKILIAGQFSTVSGVGRGNVARLNADGTLDTTFGNGLTGANSPVNDLALQSDGKVIVGGSFARVNGTFRNGVARLNADGTLDTTFGITVNVNGNSVAAVRLQSDGKVIVGGSFTQVSGVTATNLVRLTATGTLDASFSQNLFTSIGEIVFGLAIRDDGRILVGGAFGQIGGVARSQLARLSAVGVVDETFVPGLGRAGLVNAITLQPDGKMLVGGDFDTLNGLPRGKVGRLNPDGTTDTTFGAVQIGPADVAPVRAVAVQADGKILVGGRFDQINGAARGSVARLNTDGTLDPTFGNGLSGTFETSVESGVYTILPLPNGQILVGGFFTTFNGVSSPRIVRLNADGSLDPTFSVGLVSLGFVRAIVRQPDGRLLVAGRFGFMLSSQDLGLIRLNADGTVDSTFLSVTLGGALTGGVSDGVGALILQPDGKIFIGGNFVSVNGAPRSAIARINADGTLDTGFANDGAGPNQEVNGAVRQPDGKFIIGGEFTSVAGQARSRIARLNADGTLEPTFGNGLSGAIDALSPAFGAPPSIFAVALQPDGKPVVGGLFNFINDVFHCGIARLVNPASCPTITVGPAGSTLPNGQVNSAYSQTFTQTGGAAPASFAVTAGALPAGLTLAGDGTLTGAPTVTGAFNFTVTATDANGCFGSRAYSLSVNCQNISVEPTLATLPGGTLGVAYSQAFTQTGGVGTTVFTFSGGALPPGLTFTPGTATLSGTPMASGTYLFSILATDANGCTGSRVYSLSVSCPILALNPTNPTLPGGTVGTPYSEVLSVTGGTGPYNLSIVGGVLPMGISLTGGGTLAGSPFAAGNFSFTVQARDTATNCITTRTYFITIAPAATGTPVLVNDRVNLVITGQSLEAATCPGYAADIVLTGTLTNTGTTTITDPFFEVIELQAASGVTPALPYRLLTASGASCGSGGLVGSQQPVAPPTFVLNPGQSVPVTFRLALPTMGRLRFFVNVRGVLPVISQSLKAVAKRPVRVLNDLEITAVGEKSLRNR